MKIKIPDHISLILQRYAQNGFDAYCVGGSVRDSLMGAEPSDWDIAVNALPEKTKELFGDFKIVDTGIKHGTVSIIYNKRCIEVTTFRTDGDYTDNRHPESVVFSRSINDDLSRRDFTVNALAYSPEKGLIDLFDGCGDIERGTVKAVGDPDKRFCEDALRIMRALRFSAVLGFKIEEKTAEAIHRRKDLLKNISAERIAAELVKMLNGKNIFSVLITYPDVLGVFIPEILPCVGFRQYGKKHAYDVWEHICHTVETVPPEKDLRLTMLLHDLGKIPTHKLSETGDSTFKNHAAVGGVTAKDILTRLKFDKKTVNRVSFLVSHHDFEPPETKTELKKKLKTLTPDDVRTLLVIKKSDRGALSEPYRDISAGTAQTLAWLDEIARNGECCTVAGLKVNGADLAKAGLKGEKIGEMLDLLLDAVIENKVANEKDALISYLTEI